MKSRNRILGIGLCCLLLVAFWIQPGRSPKSEDIWEDLPVSLNGKLPDAQIDSLWRQGLEEKVWHNCIPTSRILRRTWVASNFFDDPKIVKLCEAIFECDVSKMESLIELGANVNAQGSCRMNPLYWAFHQNTDPRPFSCLVKHGADPNVMVNMMGRKEIQAVFPGYSVTQLSVRGPYNRHFQTVFENGGDPNSVNECPSESRQIPAFFSLNWRAPDCKERLKLMIEKGADLDIPTNRGVTFLIANVSSNERCCELAMIALDLGGADHRIVIKIDDGEHAGCYFRAIHFAVGVVDRLDGSIRWHPNLRKLIDRLGELGDSIEDARADLDRWAQWKREGLEELISIEHEIRISDESGERLEQWYASGMQKDIDTIRSEAENR